MRASSSLVFALPALAAAQQQIPLVDQVKGWVNKAQSYMSSIAPATPAAPSKGPVDAATAEFASRAVAPITLENWKSVLLPSPSASSEGPEEWLIFITGGNSTCFGMCGNATQGWNEAVTLLATKPNPPQLGLVDCESESIFCNAWAVAPASIYHMLLPKPLPDQSKPANTVRYLALNRSMTSTQLATKISRLHIAETYKDIKPYEGYWHPFDGPIVQYGLEVPIAYIVWGFSKMPSWLPMIAISFLSRSFMGRRAAPAAGARQGGARPAAAG